MVRSSLSCDDGSMHVESIGDGPRHLLVLPGWRLDSQTEIPEWSPVIAERAGWIAHFVDLPGTGRSRRPEVTVTNQDEILDRLLELVDGPLAAAEPLVVAGTSNGAALALGLVRDRPQRFAGLAVRVPNLLPDDAERVRQGQRAWQAAFDALPASYRAAHAAKIADSWEPSRDERTDNDMVGPIRSDPTRYGISGLLNEPLAFDRPTLAVMARQDGHVGWATAARYFDRFDRATVVVLDEAGHALPAGRGQTRLWRALTHDWLDRVEEDLTPWQE
jgi:pimeloyl-ACP methyl ester carboxylesterase